MPTFQPKTDNLFFILLASRNGLSGSFMPDIWACLVGLTQLHGAWLSQPASACDWCPWPVMEKSNMPLRHGPPMNHCNLSRSVMWRNVLSSVPHLMIDSQVSISIPQENSLIALAAQIVNLMHWPLVILTSVPRLRKGFRAVIFCCTWSQLNRQIQVTWGITSFAVASLNGFALVAIFFVDCQTVHMFLRACPRKRSLHSSPVGTRKIQL